MKKKEGILSVTIERSFRNRDFAYLHELFARFGCGIATRDSQETLFDIACRSIPGGVNSTARATWSAS